MQTILIHRLTYYDLFTINVFETGKTFLIVNYAVEGNLFCSPSIVCMFSISQTSCGL